MAEKPGRRGSAVGVVTVDDHEPFRRSAREVIEATAGFELLAEAASGEEAVELVEVVSPDLVFVDVRLPGMDGFETSRRVHARRPSATVVLVSADDVGAPPASSGAAAFVEKKVFGCAMLRRVWDEHGAAKDSPPRPSPR
jgi:CheY-like chemotaxis protein